MIEDKLNFIQWLCNRLVNKYFYTENDPIISSLYELKLLLSQLKDISINDMDLDKIIIKYYADFYLDKDNELGFGYTDQERNILRITVKSVTQDILDTILKG